MFSEFPDAITLLKADHRAVKDLFDEFAATSAPSQQKALARKICTELGEPVA